MDISEENDNNQLHKNFRKKRSFHKVFNRELKAERSYKLLCWNPVPPFSFLKPMFSLEFHNDYTQYGFIRNGL